MTTSSERDALVARLRKIQSVGGSLLSNATAAVKAAEGITVTDPAPEPAPTPSAVGVQTISLPVGQITAAELVALASQAHDGWLLLQADSPGATTVAGDTTFSGLTRVAIAGVRFDGSVWPTAGTNRLVLWYCDVAGTSGRAGVNIVSQSGAAPGEHIYLMGTDVHDCDHDGIKAETSNVRFQGGRMWAISDPAGLNHDDCYQTRRGTGQQVLDFVFGLDKAGNASSNGHTQVQSDLGAVGMEMGRGWIANSGNYPVTNGDKGTGNACDLNIHDVYAWDCQYNKAICNNSGGAVASTNNSLSAPPAGEVPPDVAWQAANPYGTAAHWLTSECP